MKIKKEKTTINEEKIVENKVAKNYLTWIIPLLVVVLGAAAYWKWGTVAVVNGKPISRLAYYLALEKQDNKLLLERMVEESIIEGEAAKKGIKVEQGTIDEEIKKIEERLKEQGSDLESALSMQGMTKAELENQVRLQKTIEKLVNPKNEFSQEEIDEFLKTNKDLLPTGKNKEELQTIAKDELTSQEANKAISEWFSKVKGEAKIVYR